MIGSRPLLRCLMALGALFAVGFPIELRAQGDAGSRALAVQLFDEAEALFAKNQFDQACPKYAESYRLDPQLGALMYLAECLEKNGQLASAWGSFREAEELARKRGDARADQARDRASALEPRLSYLVVQVPPEVRVPGLELLRDGAPLAQVLWGGRAAVDAGKHRIEARAPGYKSWSSEVIVKDEQSTSSVDVPKLVAAPASQSSSGAAERGASPGSGQRIAALAVGGLGIVGLGVGGFFGLSAQASLSDSETLCNDKNYCTAQGADLRDSASSKALVSTVATGVGAAALIGAAVLWFTAPKAAPVGKRRLVPRRELAWNLAPAQHHLGLEVRHDFE